MHCVCYRWVGFSFHFLAWPFILYTWTSTTIITIAKKYKKLIRKLHSSAIWWQQSSKENLKWKSKFLWHFSFYWATSFFTYKSCMVIVHTPRTRACMHIILLLLCRPSNFILLPFFFVYHHQRKEKKKKRKKNNHYQFCSMILWRRWCRRFV